MRYVKCCLIAAAAVACAACGDPRTDDQRGYTKAPLERPALVIDGERPGPMRELGTPNLPRPVVIQLEGAAEG